MAALSGSVSPPKANGTLVRAGFIRLRWLGYIRYQDLVVGGAVSFVILTALVALLPMNRYAVVSLGFLIVIAIGLGLYGRALTYREEVKLSTSGGLYIAEHRGTGDIRHGETPEEALSSLTRALEWGRDDT